MSEKTGNSLFLKKFPGSEFLAQRFGGEDLHELSTANINWLLSIAANPICNGMTHSTRKVRTTIHRLFRKRQFIYKPKIASAQEKNLRAMKKKRTAPRDRKHLPSPCRMPPEESRPPSFLSKPVLCAPPLYCSTA